LKEGLKYHQQGNVVERERVFSLSWVHSFFTLVVSFLYSPFSHFLSFIYVTSFLVCFYCLFLVLISVSQLMSFISSRLHNLLKRLVVVVVDVAARDQGFCVCLRVAPANATGTTAGKS
jgi:uncharacterized membrane protein